MIFVDFFSSSDQLEREFYPHLNQLTAQEYPLIRYDQLTQGHSQPSYYLYFNSSQNMPVGLTTTRELEIKLPKTTFKRAQSFLVFMGRSLGHGKSGLFIDARFESECQKRYQDIVRNALANDKFDGFILDESILPESELSIFHRKTVFTDFSPLFYVSYRHYSGYLKGLKPQSARKVQKLWNSLKEKKFLMGEYPSFGQSNLAGRMRLTPEQKLTLGIGQESGVLTFEKDNKLEGIILLFQGQENTLFVSFAYVGKNIDILLYFQYAILYSLELNEIQRVRFMLSPEQSLLINQELQHFSISLTKQEIILYSKKKKEMERAIPLIVEQLSRNGNSFKNFVRYH